DAERPGVQFLKRGRVTDLWTNRLIGRFTRVDGTDRASRAGFVGRHLGLDQVGDGDRGDDQNDRHDDQKLDKRETLLLLLHAVSLKVCCCQSTAKGCARPGPLGATVYTNVSIPYSKKIKALAECQL